MGAALRLARRGLGRTWPNPAVGCLIVGGAGEDARILGRGWTQPGGRPHAETGALAEAAEAARGATLYVTLEPCAHHGRTPPCAEAIIAAGIARVVSALRDPDPRVAGQGHEMLRQAGIEVMEGVCEDEALAVNIGHVTRVSQGRPFIQLKLAHSRDGRIAGPGREQVAISGDIARGWVHRMRAQADAILVGAGTLAADDPLLTCRLPGAAARSPVRVVLDSAKGAGPGARIFADAGGAPVWLLSAQEKAEERAGVLRGSSAEVIAIAADAGGRPEIGAAMSALGARGITRLMVEGGAEIAAALVAADLADEVVLIEGTLEIGEGGLKVFGREGPGLVASSRQFVLADEFALGEDHWRRYSRRG